MKAWKKEGDYQKDVIDRIKEALPGAIVMKNDSSYIQGIPDLTVIYGDKYAMLEVKKSQHDYLYNQQPNQEDYIQQFHDWGAFSYFIYPEVDDVVFKELIGYFGGGCDVQV